MALYFFDITDGRPHPDDTGTECADREAVREAARQTLAAMVDEQVPAGGDQRIISVIVRDQSGKPVYAGTLSLAGIWLDERPEPPAG